MNTYVPAFSGRGPMLPVVVRHVVHYRWLFTALSLTLVFNLVDALATLTWIELGYATEANPIMAELLAAGPVAFVGAKLVLVSGGAYVLWTRRSHKLAVAAIILAFVVYSLLFFVHLEEVEYRVAMIMVEVYSS